MSDKKIKIITRTHVQKSGAKWVFSILLLAFLITMVLSYISAEAMPYVPLPVAFTLLILFISVGILFDLIATAVTSADEAPFHSMASHKVRGARQAIWLIRNAEKVASVCGDVAGDIVGIISGVATSVILMRLVGDGEIFTSLFLTSTVAAIMIGGKAVGKGMAITNCNQIIYSVGLCLSFLGVARKKRKR